MSSLAEDVRFAFRLLRKAPAFTVVALATLALGIGANTALFSVVHTVLLRPLPFHEPDRLYWIWSRHSSTDRYPFSLPEFCDYRDQNRSLAGLAGFANWPGTLTGDGPAERLTGLRVSANFFDLLGAPAFVGRTLRPEDDLPGHEKVVVLSHGLWQRRFGGDEGIVGRTLTLNSEPYLVVGVLRRGFFFPIRDVDVAIPLAPDQDPWRHNRDSTNFIRTVGRARNGVSRAQIADDLEAIGRRLRQEFPKSYERKQGVLAVPYAEELTRSFSQTLYVLLAAVGLLLVIACANLANLMLVRATERRREMAIRQALGARTGRLARLLLTECALLALGGALLGVLLAHWVVPALMSLSPAAMPRAKEVAISLPVLLFTLGVTFVSACAFGLAPAWGTAQAQPGDDLKAGGRAGAGSVQRSRARGLIVAAQVAVMTVLLTGAGLLLRSFREVLRVEPGFDSGVLTLRLSLPRKDYPELGRVSRFYRELEARVAAMPGVASVAAVSQVPLNNALSTADYKVADRPPASESALPTAQYRMITPAYFATMGIPLRAGRPFTDDDRQGGAAVVVISQELARQSFPDRSPIGRHLLVQDNPQGFRSLEIVGVVADIKHQTLEAVSHPYLYVPYHQVNKDLLVWLVQNQFLVVRGGVFPLSLADGIRRELQRVDPNVAAADIRTTGAYVEAAVAPRRFTLVLLGAFAGLALTLATVGIYGVVGYTVALRTRETGVRLALGARRAHIFGLVVGESLRRTLLGIGVGLVAALATGRALQGLLFGVEPFDPLVYAGGIGVLVAVTLLASAPPGWRAARVDPLVALRD